MQDFPPREEQRAGPPAPGGAELRPPKEIELAPGTRELGRLAEELVSGKAREETAPDMTTKSALVTKRQPARKHLGTGRTCRDCRGAHPGAPSAQHPDHRRGGEDGAGRARGERPGDQAAPRPGAPPPQQAGPARAIQWHPSQNPSSIQTPEKVEKMEPDEPAESALVTKHQLDLECPRPGRPAPPLPPSGKVARATVENDILPETPVEKDIMPKALTKTPTESEIVDTAGDRHNRQGGDHYGEVHHNHHNATSENCQAAPGGTRQPPLAEPSQAGLWSRTTPCCEP